ncbi:hypothetical protein ACFL34_02905 [Candidatus Sumerlaeota bacterium]
MPRNKLNCFEILKSPDSKLRFEDVGDSESSIILSHPDYDTDVVVASAHKSAAYFEELPLEDVKAMIVKHFEDTTTAMANNLIDLLQEA